MKEQKKGQIIFSASNDTMGDNPPEYCDKFRKFAEEQIKTFYPEFDVLITPESSTVETYVEFYGEETDYKLEDEIQIFCNGLWDKF